MSARKREAQLRALEDQILQYKAVVDYLSDKNDLSVIPATNQFCIAKVLRDNGWRCDNNLWIKADLRLDLIQAAKKEFGELYNRFRVAHLKRTVPGFKEG